MFNMLANIEQAHLYQIADHSTGQILGTIAEKDSIQLYLFRQFTRLIRPFTIDILVNGKSYTMSRPFSLLNSKITTFKNGIDCGKVNTHWHPFRRQYDLYTKYNSNYNQFGRIDSPFFSWDFVIRDDTKQPRCYINRLFRGALTELLTDQGLYVITFKDKSIQNPLNDNEKLSAIACAISIDYDYFSRHSGPFSTIGSNIQLQRQRELPDALK